MSLSGPLLVLGANGFIGCHLFRKLRVGRDNVYGAIRTFPADGMPAKGIFTLDLETHARALFEYVKPRVIFDCVAYGGYLAQKDIPRIYRTNAELKAQLLELAAEYKITYVHCGSSSEYGRILDAPLEDSALQPNSHYAVAKGAGAGLINYFGKHRGLRCANLRLYAVYGPGEREDDRLIPQLIKAARGGAFPPLGDPLISRDFIHVDDVCEALIAAAVSLEHEPAAILGAAPGDSFNIGTGTPTSLWELAYLVRDIFSLKADPVFSPRAYFREYDFPGRWCADITKARTRLGWWPKIRLREGLESLSW